MKNWVRPLFCLMILAGAGKLSAQQFHFGDSIAIITGIDDLQVRRLSLRRLIEIEQLNRFPDTLAQALHQLAYAEEYSTQYEQACISNLRALHLREALMNSEPNAQTKETFCRSAFNLARNYYYADKRDSALYYYALVIQISPVNRQKAKSAYEIGRIYLNEREFALTRSYTLESLRLATEDSLQFEIQNAYVLLLDGFNALLHDGGVQQAADSIFFYAGKANTYFTQLSPPLDEDAIINYSKVHFLESNAYKARKEYGIAENLMTEAQRLYNQLSPDSEVREISYESELYNSMGILLRRIGRYDQSYRSLQRALEIRRASGDSIYVAVTQNNLGDLFRDQARYDSALVHYHASILEIVGHNDKYNARRMPSVQDIKDHPMLADLFKYVGFEANGWLQYYKADKDSSYCRTAIRLYELADSLVDIMRFKHLRESSKLLWREDAKRLYAGAIDAALQVGEYDRALYFSDRSKAVLVLDAVHEHMMRNTPARELMEKKDSLQERIAALEKSGNTDQQWITLTATLDQVNSQLRQVIPHFAEPSNSFSEARLHDLQKHLIQGEAIIQYFDTPESRDHFDARDTLYAFVITRERISGIGLDKPAVMQALREYQEMNSAFLERGIVDTMLSGPDPLYTLLIQPLEPLPNALTIIPDGAIAQIGFDGLRDQDGRYLIESKTIRYDLSLAMAQAMAEMQPGNHVRMLGFAPMTEALCAQSTLPYTRKELKGIASIVKSTLFFGKTASKSHLFALAKEYGILHLATHASANTKEPGQSWVALSGDTAACDLLYVQDLYTQYLPSSMVVVSACEGAHGVYASGEGAMSVARGFAFAGAASIVTSLWQVNDEATADIMKSYYSHLKKGLAKSEALRQAKLEYIHDKNRKKMELHPAWWSAFIVIGNDSPLELEPAGNFSFVYFIIIAFVAIAVIMYYRWKRRSSFAKASADAVRR